MTSGADVDFLDLDDLIVVASEVIEGVQVRDLGLLASAAARPRASAFGSDAYPTFPEKAAALLHSLARNHALVDGNKRLSWSATRIFCLLNGKDLAYSVDDAEALIIAAAAGEVDVPAIALSLSNHLTNSPG